MVQSWEKEAGVLQKMNLLNHPHIVRFITAFRRGESGGMMITTSCWNGPTVEISETYGKITLDPA